MAWWRCLLSKLAGKPSCVLYFEWSEMILIRFLGFVESFQRMISLSAWETMQEWLKGGGGGKRVSCVLDRIEKRLRSRRKCLGGIMIFSSLSRSLGDIAINASQVLMASSRMLSSDRFGFLGVTSSFWKSIWWSEKNEISEGVHALRFVDEVESAESS